MQPMCITIASAKGGTGKSTMAANLAVQAVEDGNSASLLDWEPQGSITLWWTLRGKPDNPSIERDIDDPVETVNELKAEGVDWVFIDTPPDGVDELSRAIDAADFVLIPVRAGLFDAHAVELTVALCNERGTPFAFVLNAINPSRKALNASAIRHLETKGKVLSAQITDRACYVTALNKGLSAAEHPDGKQAKPAKSELDALWKEIKQIVKRGRS